MYCKNYVGIACVDGSCPVALREEYAECCGPVLYNCAECWMYRGCEDCAFDGTDMCDRKNIV